MESFSPVPFAWVIGLPLGLSGLLRISQFQILMFCNRPRLEDNVSSTGWLSKHQGRENQELGQRQDEGLTCCLVGLAEGQCSSRLSLLPFNEDIEGRWRNVRKEALRGGLHTR